MGSHGEKKMEVSMKKAVLVLLVLLASGALAFASGAQEPAAAPAAAAGEQRAKTPIEVYNPGFAFPAGRIELSYWHVLGSRPGFHELAQQFAAKYSELHPNVSISVRDIPNAQQRAIWSAAFESKTAPDIAWTEAQVGLRATGLREAPPWAVKMMEETFTAYSLTLSKVGGKYYGWSGAEVDAGQMLYYRKDMFRENGLDPNKPPIYLPEWLDAAKKCTKVDSSGRMTVAGVSVRYAGGHQGIGDKFSKYAASFVDTSKRFYYNEDYTDVIFDDPGWIAAAQFYQDLVFKYKVTNTTLPIPIQAVAQGLAAMTNRETFYAGWLKENAPDVEYGIGPLPSGKAPLGQYMTGAMPWLALQSVTVDSKNPEVAWDFNMFFMTPDNELAIVKNNGGMSRLKAHQNDPFFKTLPYYDVYVTMTSDRPIVRNVYLDPNTLQAELEAKLGEAALTLLTDAKADAGKLMKDLAAYGRQRIKEIK
jgi:ABC-type glycerol-3-phosphate transport system substrate-binding protein